MAETADDLTAPLGQENARRKRSYRLPFTGTQALATLLGLFLITFVGFAIFNDNPLGGEPMVRLAMEQGRLAEEKIAAAPPAREALPAAKQATSGEQKTVTIIDGPSGARQSVLIGGAAVGHPGTGPEPGPMAGAARRVLSTSR